VSLHSPHRADTPFGALTVYSEIKAVLVVRDQDFRKKLIDDVSGL
jgi:hypothetical protein